MNKTLENLKIMREQLGREISRSIKFSRETWFLNLRKSAEFLDDTIKILEKYKDG